MIRGDRYQPVAKHNRLESRHLDAETVPEFSQVRVARQVFLYPQDATETKIRSLLD